MWDQPTLRTPVFSDLDGLRSSAAALFFSAYVLIFLLVLFTSLCLASAFLCNSVFLVVARFPAALFLTIPLTREPTRSEMEPLPPLLASMPPAVLSMRFIALSPRADNGFCICAIVVPISAAISSRSRLAISASSSIARVR